MKQHWHGRERDQEMEELLKHYENLQKGRGVGYLEEEAFEKIIEYFELNEQFKNALQAVNIAMVHFPFSGALLVKKADLILNNREYGEALELLDQASIFDNSNIDIYILKTEALLALDRQEEAVALLEQALTHFSGDERIDLLFELADVYDDYENFDKVFECLQMILDQEPGNEEALYKICFWTDFTGRNAESIDIHQKIINELPYNELAWFNLGSAYQGIKLYEKAIDAYKYAIAIDEKFEYAYRNMGDAYIRLRKYKDAIESLEKVNELSQPEDIIYEAMAYCYEKLHNYGLARFYFRKASHLNPQNSFLFYKVAYMYYKEDKWEPAVRQLETAIKIKRNKAEYELLMGECKQRLGQTREAIQYFLNAVRLKPKAVAVWEALIIALYHEAFYEEALEQVGTALKMTHYKPVFLFYEAALYFALKKNKEALLVLEDALAQAPVLLKKITQLNPALLQVQGVTDLIIRYKKRKKK